MGAGSRRLTNIRTVPNPMINAPTSGWGPPKFARSSDVSRIPAAACAGSWRATELPTPPGSLWSTATNNKLVTSVR